MMAKVSSRRKKWRSRKWCSPLSWHSRWYGSHYFVSSYWRELPSGLSRGTLWCWCRMVLISVAWLTLCYMPWWTGLTERNLSLSCGILYFTSATVLTVASFACNKSNTRKRVWKISWGWLEIKVTQIWNWKILKWHHLLSRFISNVEKCRECNKATKEKWDTQVC